MGTVPYGANELPKNNATKTVSFLAETQCLVQSRSSACVHGGRASWPRPYRPPFSDGDGQTVVMVGGCKSVTAGGLRALRMMAAWWQSQKLVFSFFLFGWSVLAQC